MRAPEGRVMTVYEVRGVLTPHVANLAVVQEKKASAFDKLPPNTQKEQSRDKINKTFTVSYYCKSYKRNQNDSHDAFVYILCIRYDGLPTLLLITQWRGEGAFL